MPDKLALEDVRKIANLFDVNEITDVKAHGNGNINDTFIASSMTTRYILQRVNTDIFKSPKTVMSNMDMVTKHIQNCIDRKNLGWKVQKIIQSKEGKNFVIQAGGDFWRMISFIEESRSYERLESTEKAYELGKAIGLYHALMSEMRHDKIKYVLSGFHIVPEYLAGYDKIRKKDTPDDKESMFAFSFIKKHRESATSLEQGKVCGDLPLRIIHGDLKINNILFSSHSSQAISIIDLDTVQPGLVHYDIGDCMRSSCNRAGEETQQWQDIRFDTKLFRHIWRGYLIHAHKFLNNIEYDYVFDSVFAITFEIGLRFFTDYLSGDTYFKIHYPKNNLYRALVQFQLAQSILEQKDTIRDIIAQESYKYKENIASELL